MTIYKQYTNNINKANTMFLVKKLNSLRKGIRNLIFGKNKNNESKKINENTMNQSNEEQINNSNSNSNSNPEWKNTIPFVPPVKNGFVIKVYDGDTITIACQLPYSDSPMYRFSVRLNGIDCPEMKGKNEDEKDVAKIAQSFLSDLILNKMVHLENIQTEKYGRILADVYLDNLNLNKHMIEKRLAVCYDGGTKICPVSWKKYYLTGELN